MIDLGSISEGETDFQSLQDLLELSTGNRIAGFSGETLEEGNASPVERSALALHPCGIQEMLGANRLCASTAPGALRLSTFCHPHVVSCTGSR